MSVTRPSIEPIAVACHRSAQMPRHSSGYTLLEMVVVLAIISLITAMVAPPMFKTVERWRARNSADDIERQLQRLPVLVARAGQPLRLASAKDWPAKLPPLELGDWTLVFREPLVVQANGFCESARIELQQDERRIPLRIDSPFCRIAPDSRPAR